MLWLFVGAIVLTVFLLAFFVIDMVYSIRIFNGSSISNGESIMLITINVFGLLIVLSMLGMFFYQIFFYMRKEGLKPPPLTPQAIAKEFNVDPTMVNDFFNIAKGGGMKKDKMMKECQSNCPKPCGSCYGPPTAY